MKEVTVTTTVSVPDNAQSIEEPVLPVDAQAVIDIANAVGANVRGDHFELVFKAAVQAVFGQVNW